MDAARKESEFFAKLVVARWYVRYPSGLAAFVLAGGFVALLADHKLWWLGYTAAAGLALYAAVLVRELSLLAIAIGFFAWVRTWSFEAKVGFASLSVLVGFGLALGAVERSFQKKIDALQRQIDALRDARHPH